MGLIMELIGAVIIIGLLVYGGKKFYDSYTVMRFKASKYDESRHLKNTDAQ